MIRTLAVGYVLGAIAACEVIAAGILVRRANRLIRAWDRQITDLARAFGR